MSNPPAPEPPPPNRSSPAVPGPPAAEPPGSAAVQRADSPKPFRYRRWLGLLLVGLLVGVILLPRLISSRWVYQPMLERMQTGDFHFSVDAVELHWFEPIQLRGITISQIRPAALGDPGLGDFGGAASRPPLVQIQQAGTDRGLWGYLLSGRELGRLEIVQPVVDFELLQEDGSLPELLRALGAEPDPTRPDVQRGLPPVNVAIAIRDARVVVRQVGRSDPLVVVPSFDMEIAYRASEGESWLHIAPTKLLNRVALTPELMQLGLEYVVPVLARSAWLSGDVSAELGALEIPLARPRQAAATAEVTFHSVRAGVSQPALQAGLRRIATLLGREPTDEVVLADGTIVKVVMAAGVVHHEGMQLGLPRVDPRLQLTSQGDVSLEDRGLDLVLSIPVPVAMLARRDVVRELGVPTVRLPVQGTIERPELQWTQLRGDTASVIAAIGGQLAEDAPLSSAVIGALGGVAGGEADQAISSAARALLELRQRVQQRRAAAEIAEPAEQADADAADGPPQQDEAAPSRWRSLLDRLREGAAR